MNFLDMLRCLVRPKSCPVRYDPEDDEYVRWLRDQREAAEAAAATVRRRIQDDPFPVFGNGHGHGKGHRR
jgi:hypothetical protein